MFKFKAVLLASLVVCSVVLSTLLIFGQPVPSRAHRDTSPWFGPIPDLHEISLPQRIYVCNKYQEVSLIETMSPMYFDLVRALGLMELSNEQGGDAWVTSEFTRDTIQAGVLFRYDYQIARDLLTNWLAMFNETDFPFVAIDCIFVPLDGGAVKFINTATKTLWQLQVDLPLTVFQHTAAEAGNLSAYPMAVMESGETYAVAPGVFDLAKPEQIAVPACELQAVKTGEIISSFFLNPSVIQETDGTKTYTDGFAALRVFPSGALEYTCGGQSQGAAYYSQTQLMQKALDFIGAHGGWPENMLPASLSNRPAQSISIEFRNFARGLPVTGENLYLCVEFLADTVSNYRRNLAVADEETVQIFIEIKPLATHLATESQAGLFFAETKRLISDLTLAYYWQQDKLIPVWQVSAENKVVYVAASDGRILQIETLSGGK